MTIPVVRQITPIDSLAQHSLSRVLTFPAAVLAGNTILMIGRVWNNQATDLPSSTSSVTMTGGAFIRRGDAQQAFGVSGITAWTAENVAAGATTVTWVPALVNGGNYTTLMALEIDGRDVGPFEAIALSNGVTNGIFECSVGPCPTSGSISQADTLAIVCTFADGSTNAADVGWLTPAGWTEVASTDSSLSGLRPIFVAKKELTLTDAVSVTITSTAADSAGRAAALIILRGSVAAPTPPPPSPTPTPTPSPPTPPPAATKGFQFLNLDPTLAGVITDLIIQIHMPPTTEPLLGSFIQGAAAQSFVGAGTYSKVVVTHDGVVPVTVGQAVVAVGRNASGTAGFRGTISGTVIAL